ncbi:linear amide C-N hydrolase [Telmatocola sphagniphila]|uniref:Linear amide C-N hydrolase n=1 Tax=Telmatocola sphagniphila TaxID=1123043 RepID=A0A8E6EY90_9BACT|nr:linear amide C-N hydrolase [Telmatocola sphagniphila]QVL32438.1 linear amide C-N hydrolase [Telmatocola sphagniphila]
MRRLIASLLLLGMIAFGTLGLNAYRANACTRVVYFGLETQTVTGRTMDWVEDMHTNLWVFPRGMKRDGGLGKGSLEWKSRYGSVVASVYEGGTADGMNEKGLVANLLYLAESEYPTADDKRPGVCISVWAQYLLDNFATVKEAVEELKKDSFRVVSVEAPNGMKGTVHLSISDSSGDSAIFEYVQGKLVIHQGKQYQVMTNSPTYDKQLAINEYWKEFDGAVMLPGTVRAADRFARASYYVNACQQSADAREAVAAVFSVMRNVSVPRGIRKKGAPNLSSTIWRTVADQKNLVYYFEDTNSPGVLWVKLNKMDFAEGSGVRKLTLAGKPDVLGDQSGNFEKCEPFKFLAPPQK